MLINTLQKLILFFQVSPVLDICHRNFQMSNKNRKEEIIAINNQIDVLEDEVIFMNYKIAYS